MQPLSYAASARGASLRRSDTVSDASLPVAFEAERLQMVDEVYDVGGAYWGSGMGKTHIYRFAGESSAGREELFIRAASMKDAESEVLSRYPNASFAVDAGLEDFLGGYCSAALFSTTNDAYEDDRENESEFLDGTGLPFSDETMDLFREDCRLFLAENAALVAEACATDGYNMSRAGQDFWLTRNGHGSGFSDIASGSPWDDLQAAAQEYEEVYLFVDVHAIRSSKELPDPSAPSPTA